MPSHIISPFHLFSFPPSISSTSLASLYESPFDYLMAPAREGRLFPLEVKSLELSDVESGFDLTRNDVNWEQFRTPFKIADYCRRFAFKGSMSGKVSDVI